MLAVLRTEVTTIVAVAPLDVVAPVKIFKYILILIEVYVSIVADLLRNKGEGKGSERESIPLKRKPSPKMRLVVVNTRVFGKLI